MEKNESEKNARRAAASSNELLPAILFISFLPFFLLLYFVGIFVFRIVNLCTNEYYILYYFVSQFSVLFFALAYSESSVGCQKIQYTLGSFLGFSK